MASIAVFDTTELLERVYSFLPMKDLVLNAPVVSRRSKSVIEQSKVLQRLLFRIPEKPKSRWLLADADESEDGKRSLTEVPLDTEHRYIRPGRYHTPRGLLFNALHLNEPFLKAPGPEDPWNLRHISGGVYIIYFKSPLVDIKEHYSCRSMFLTQPPSTEMHVSWLDEDAGESLGDCEIRNNTGVTLADFLRHAEKVKEAWEDENIDWKGWLYCEIFPRGVAEAGLELLKESIAEEKKSEPTAESSSDQG